MSTKTQQWENVKMKKAVVNKLRSQKKRTGVSIMAFAEQAISEKLSSDGFLNWFKSEHGLGNVDTITYNQKTLKWRVSYHIGNTDEFDTFDSMYEYFRAEDSSE